MKPKQTVAKVSTKPKKQKTTWTKDSASDYVKRAKSKGLKYWAAADYLKKVHGVIVE